MAVFKLSSPLIKVAVSLALLLNVIILSGAYPSTSVDEKEDESGNEKKLIDTTNWSDIWKSLNADGLDFDTVFEKLTELKALFDTHRVPEDLIMYRNLINDLLKIRALDNKSCEDDLITNIGRFIKGISRDKSISRYAIEFGYSQLKVCTDLISEAAEKAIKEIEKGHGNSYRVDMYYLEDYVKMEVVDAPKKRYFEKNYVEEYVKAIKMVLRRERRTGEKKESSIIYEEHIIRPCKFWRRVTDRLRRLHPFLNPYAISVEVKTTIVFGDMCDYILTNRKMLERRLFIRVADL